MIRRNVTTVTGDVSRLEDLDRLYAVVKEKHGQIDILFANAGGVKSLRWKRRPRLISTRLSTSTQRDLLFRAKGPSPFQRWRLDHPDLFGCQCQGSSRVYRLRCKQGRCELFRPRLDDGAGGSQDSGEFDEPWPNRNSPLENAGLTAEQVKQAAAQFASEVPLGRRGKPEESLLPSCSLLPMKVPTSPAWISPSMGASQV